MNIIPICDRCETPDRCVKRFRLCAERAGLTVTLESYLKAVPGSTHLHLRPRDERSGTLEYTMAPTERRAWLSFHDNRERPWIAQSITLLLGCACPCSGAVDCVQ